METAAKQQALDAALAQIDHAFGGGRDTPEGRRMRARHRLERLVPALEGARDAVKAEKASPVGECPDIAIDPFAAFAVSWFLRRESDRDDCPKEAWDPMEGAAEDISSGTIFGSAEEMLNDLVDEIHHHSYIVEHGEEPPHPLPEGYRREADWDGLPY